MKKILIVLFLILIPAVLFVGTIRGVKGEPDAYQFKGNLDQATKPFELSPERGRYAHIYSLAEDHHYDLDMDWAEAVYPDVGYSQGKFYSFFAPGISYLALPFYDLGKKVDLAQVFAFGFISLCALLSLLVLYRIARDIFRLPMSLSFFVPIVYAFATTSWSYAITLYQHHVFVLLALSSFYAVWKYKNSPGTGWLWASWVWLAYGLAILIDYPNAVLMLPVMIYFVIASIRIVSTGDRIKFSLRATILTTFVIFVGISILHGYHNQIHFGSWRQLSGGIVSYKSIKDNNVLNQPDAQQEIADLQARKTVTSFFSEDKFTFGFFTLLVSPDRGLFLYAPILLLGLVGMVFAARHMKMEHGVLMALVGINVLLYSSWGDPWGGWAFGPRYLIPSMAIMALYVGRFLHQFRYRIWGKLMALILFVFSAGVALLGALTTNAVPPKVEADQLHTGYNFLYNWKFFQAGHSGSFVYNTYLSGKLNLMLYAELILGLLVLVAAIVLFIIPLFEHDQHHD
jgi:hypothetical protein